MEIVEFCAHCDSESVHRDYQPEKQGYIVRCTECGSQICLCDACQHDQDNPDRFCDWHRVRENKRWEQGRCFRGTTFNLK